MNSISHGPNPSILVVEAGSALLALEFAAEAPAGQVEADRIHAWNHTALHFAIYSGTPFFCFLLRNAVARNLHLFPFFLGKKHLATF